MDIAFYKPGKKVYFHDDSEDYAAWSYEVVNLMRIFADHGHMCYILSENDLAQNIPIPKIKSTSWDVDNTMKYDRCFFFSGAYTIKDLNMLRNIQATNIDFYFTDLRLDIPEKFKKYFRYIYSIQRDYPGRRYAGNNESYLYKASVRPTTSKLIKIYYGGGERNRLDKIFEYIWRPGVIWTGRSPFFQRDTRIYDRNRYLEYLDMTKYSICILDNDYSETNALTQRHYEHVIHNIFSFIDNDFDRKGYMIPLYDWRRVSSFREMYEKIEHLERHPDEYLYKLEKQRDILKPEYYNGEYVYGLLKDDY